ncbi:hypothetical protein FOZ62_012115, partial [Perkinsus olseni]
MATTIQDMIKCRVNDDKAMWKILQDTFKVRSLVADQSLAVEKLGDYMGKDLYGEKPTKTYGEDGGTLTNATSLDPESAPSDIQMDEVTEVMKRAKNKKRRGVDGLRADIFKIVTGTAKSLHR